MAAIGSASPASPNGKSIERLLQEAQIEGKLHIVKRKLKCLPKSATRYDLRDTTDVDLSWNRLSDIPRLVCEFHSMQMLRVSHNVIKHIPSAVAHLTSLRHLDLSRNHLSHLPIAVCRLQALEVLLVASNRLVSIPEEISLLQRLTELDVSCNQLTCLPSQLCDLKSIRVLNARHNLLLEIPVELYRLQLRQLDLSGNKLRHVPHQYQLMNTLEALRLDCNPLVSPPANLCSRGIEHVMKFLLVESKKEARRPGSSSALQHSEAGSSPALYHRSRFVGGVRCDLLNGMSPARPAPESGYGTNESLHSAAAGAVPPVAPVERPSSASSTSSVQTTTGSAPPGALAAGDDAFSRELERARSAYASQKRRASQIKSEFARQQQQQQQAAVAAAAAAAAAAGLNGSTPPANPAAQTPGPQGPSAPTTQFSSSQTVMQRLEAQLQRGQRPPGLSTLSRVGRSASAGHTPVSATGGLGSLGGPSNGPPTAPLTSTSAIGRSGMWGSPSSRTVDPAAVRAASTELRALIESRLKIRLPEEVGSALRDGVILCHLVNQLHPRSVYSVHVPSPGQPMLGLAKCRRNVENFLEACRRLGVPEACMCAPEDVLIFNCPCTPPAAASGAGAADDDVSLRRLAKTVTALAGVSGVEPPGPGPGDRLRALVCLLILACIAGVFAAAKAACRPYEERTGYRWLTLLPRLLYAHDLDSEDGLGLSSAL